MESHPGKTRPEKELGGHIADADARRARSRCNLSGIFEVQVKIAPAIVEALG